MSENKLTPFRKRVRDSAKDYSLAAIVVDAVGSRCSVRLAQNGQLMTGLRYSGVKPAPGKKVQVDFISGTPIVLTGAGQEAAPEPQPIPASTVNSEQPPKPDYTGMILRYHGGTLMEAYPGDEDGMQEALDDCIPDDVIVLPAIELTMDVVMPDEITIKGESKETSFIYGMVSLGSNCKLTLVTIINSNTDDDADVVALANEGTNGQSVVSFCNIHASNCGTVKLGIGYLSENAGNTRISSCYLTGEDNLSANGGICASRLSGYVYIENSTLYGSFTGDVHVYNNYVDPEYVEVCEEPPPSGVDFGKTSPLDEATDVDTDVALEWGEAIGATSYEYYIDESESGGSWVSVGTDLSVEITDLDPSTTYYWQVRAVNGAGSTEADSGTKWTFTTGASSSEWSETFDFDSDAEGWEEFHTGTIVPTWVANKLCIGETDAEVWPQTVIGGWSLDVADLNIYAVEGAYFSATIHWPGDKAHTSYGAKLKIVYANPYNLDPAVIGNERPPSPPQTETLTVTVPAAHEGRKILAFTFVSYKYPVPCYVQGNYMSNVTLDGFLQVS